MERYLLFAFDSYYPQGGWTDFINSFDSLDEAIQSGMMLERDYFQVVDIESGEMVYES